MGEDPSPGHPSAEKKVGEKAKSETRDVGNKNMGKGMSCRASETVENGTDCVYAMCVRVFERARQRGGTAAASLRIYIGRENGCAPLNTLT